MRVDFYQLSRDPVETALAALAGRALAAGQRMLVVSGAAAQLDRIDKALWAADATSFLAHGRVGEDQGEQPILLSADVAPGNGAAIMALADGIWREAPEAIERILLLFDATSIDGARTCWKMLKDRPGVERRYWKQQDGKWVEGP